MAKVHQVENGFWVFECPGCGCLHSIKTPVWTFNGDLDKPTVSPSILVSGTEPITDDEHARIMNGEIIEPRPTVCHSFVTDGKIQFLGDCTHALKGQTVEIPEWN